MNGAASFLQRGRKREAPLEALPITQHSWDGVGWGGFQMTATCQSCGSCSHSALFLRGRVEGEELGVSCALTFVISHCCGLKVRKVLGAGSNGPALILHRCCRGVVSHHQFSLFCFSPQSAGLLVLHVCAAAMFGMCIILLALVK